MTALEIRCRKCGLEKPITDFSVNKSCRTGLRSDCKVCAKATFAEWYAANRAHRKAADAAWRAANPDKTKALRDSWFAANPEKVKAATVKWRSKNTLRLRVIAAAWRASNPTKKRIQNQNRRARRDALGGRLSLGLSDRLLKLQRGKCACCRRRLGNNYHMDHQMPLALGGANEDWNIQLLCPKCNHSKRALHPVEFMQKRGFLL